MQNKDKVALFDFCETIANFQTADAFVRYVQSHSKPTNKDLIFLFSLLNKLHVFSVFRRLFPKANLEKKLLLKQLKGRSQEDLLRLAEGYYNEVIKVNLIEEVICELRRLQNNGYSCYVVSAGYDVYLSYFCNEYKIDGLISTRIEFKKGICTGSFVGKDCMYEQKIYNIKATLTGNFSKWFAFTDSITDLPMLELVGYPIVVSKRISQQWAEKKNYKQIIW